MSINIVMPQMGESIVEGTIVKWLKNEGDAVKRDEMIYEVATDKVNTDIPSPEAGILRKIIVPAGAKVPVGTVVATLDESRVVAPAPVATPKAATPPPAPVPAPAAPATRPGDGRRIFSSPLVRRIARQENVDIAVLEGSGWKGRVTKKDILGHLGKAGAPAAVAPAAPPAPAASKAVPAPAGRTQAVPMSPMRAKIAEHMLHSRRTSAHVTTVFEVDMSAVVALREKEKEPFETVYGTKLTYTPFFAMACVQAIKDFPVINSSVDGNSIILKRDINIGIAVALPDGLIVPVVRNCEEKSFLGLARAVQELAERARSKKLSMDDISGGTFTITNPGIYGGLFGTPIINQPQVAIFGVGAIEKRAVVVNDAIAIRSMCYVDLSFDHRVIDGAVADQFMARVKGILQTWNTPIR